MSSTGQGLREVEEDWDLPRYQAWFKYCEQHPPLQAMVEAYLGFRKEEPMRVTEENYGQFLQMLKMDSFNGRQ
jgi:hypothetical protein